MRRTVAWLHRTLVRADLGPEADLLLLDTTTGARGMNLGRFRQGSPRHRRFLVGYGVFLATVFLLGAAAALWFAVDGAGGDPWWPPALLTALATGLAGLALYQTAGVRLMWRHRDDPPLPETAGQAPAAGPR